MISATVKEQEHVVQYLLTLPGININAKTEDGGTALTWAIQNGNVNLAKAFCERNELENINVGNDDYVYDQWLLNQDPRYWSVNLRFYREGRFRELPLPALPLAINYHRGHI